MYDLAFIHKLNNNQRRAVDGYAYAGKSLCDPDLDFDLELQNQTVGNI